MVKDAAGDSVQASALTRRSAARAWTERHLRPPHQPRRVRNQRPGDANTPAGCAHEKGLQMRVFSKRLMGFEPTTFCMASKARGAAEGPDIPAK
jgi:hypothetical protein